ncbi:hypothetical protein TNCV_1213501, partial [Trichonephila clavipes]
PFSYLFCPQASAALHAPPVPEPAHVKSMEAPPVPEPAPC